MIRFENNVSLLPYNTFGIDAHAKLFCRIQTTEQLAELIATPSYRQDQRLILGSGSNVLFTQDFDGLVIHNEIKGIESTNDNDRVLVTAGSGELWHELVLYCIAKDWGGIENLSLIPGTVGAAPIQNIGAYGIEMSNVVHEVTAIDADTGALLTFNNRQCKFEYRESAFKREYKGKVFISSVTLSLSRINHHIDIHYGAIQDTLKQHRIDHVTIKSVSDAVIEIRQSKLPDYRKVGNAGSFFKNPTVTKETLTRLHAEYPAMPFYQSDNHVVKIPAAWLIEQCGWKGKRIGDAGVHPLQALVLVNYGGASGGELVQLAEQIQTSVHKKFELLLTPEVNII